MKISEMLPFVTTPFIHPERGMHINCHGPVISRKPGHPRRLVFMLVPCRQIQGDSRGGI